MVLTRGELNGGRRSPAGLSVYRYVRSGWGGTDRDTACPLAWWLRYGRRYRRRYRRRCSGRRLWWLGTRRNQVPRIIPVLHFGLDEVDRKGERVILVAPLHHGDNAIVCHQGPAG